MHKHIMHYYKHMHYKQGMESMPWDQQAPASPQLRLIGNAMALTWANTSGDSPRHNVAAT